MCMIQVIAAMLLAFFSATINASLAFDPEFPTVLQLTNPSS